MNLGDHGEPVRVSLCSDNPAPSWPLLLGEKVFTATGSELVATEGDCPFALVNLNALMPK